MERSKQEGKYQYNPASVVLMVDLTKLVVSICGICLSGYGLEHIRKYSKMGVYYVVPAFLYTVSNNLIFYNSVHFDMATMRVLYNFRVVTSALLTQLFFHRQLGVRKWIAIYILLVGCIVCQWNGLGDMTRLWPILLMFFQCFASSLSGVANDYLMKKDMEQSIHIQNLYLYSFNFVTNLGAAMLTGENISISQLYSTLIKGYTMDTWLVIFIFVAVGLSTSILLKYLSAMLKEFASALEMVTIAVIGNFYFGEAIQLRLELIVSIILISYSLYLYNYDKIIEQQQVVKRHDLVDEENPTK